MGLVKNCEILNFSMTLNFLSSKFGKWGGITTFSGFVMNLDECLGFEGERNQETLSLMIFREREGFNKNEKKKQKLLAFIPSPKRSV